MTTQLRFLQWLLSSLVLVTVLFGCGGLIRPLERMGYLLIFVTAGAATIFVTNPSLAQERSRPGPGALDLGGHLLASLLFLATTAVAALDSGRLPRSAPVPREWQIGALILLVLLAVVQIWAMAVNPFFSSAIRLQADRGHCLVTQGPYQLIRHPGYLAMFLTMPTTAIALGSWLALLPALFYSAVILRRTIREDQFLKENLHGYTQYATIVRYRLAPGLW